jgi:uncharacterized protein YegP (UPF0339 family)
MADQSGYFIYKASNGQYYFYLRAVNGQILVTSETYTTKESAKTAIASVKANAAAGVYDMTS